MINPSEISMLSKIYCGERLNEAQIQRSSRHNKKLVSSPYRRLGYFLISVGLTLKANLNQKRLFSSLNDKQSLARD